MAEERDLYLNEEEDVRLDAIWEEHWRDVAEEGDDKRNMHALRWEVYVEYMGNLIKREFLVYIQHLKERGVVWTFVKDHIIYEK